MAPRVPLSRSKTSTSVHSCAVTQVYNPYSDIGKEPVYRRRCRCTPGRDLMQIEDISREESIKWDTIIWFRL